MGIWHEIPFLRILLPFLCGIFPGLSGFGSESLVWWLLLLALSQFLMLRAGRSLIPYTYRWVPGIFIQAFFVAAGLATGFNANIPEHKDFFGLAVEEGREQCWIVTVGSAPVIRTKRIRTLVKITALVDSSGVRKTSGKAMLYLDRRDSLLRLARGDRLMIRTGFSKPPGARVPGEFDYAAFLSRKGIRHLAHADSFSRVIISRDTGFSLTGIAGRWQRKLAGIIREQGLDKDETSVATAMLVGDTDGFGQDLRGAYARAGVTHILCVSGLHVGLVFLIFSRALFFLNHSRRQRLFKAFLLILMTWAYALLTGLSPSIQRAACMCSFMILGKILGRRNDVINSLLASAFFLLLTDPLIIFNYGFQLSYLAVAGIVLLEPLIYPWIYLPNPLLDKGWKLAAVSIAAQLATGPLAVYHFHQFPTWFIPANLMTIPLSGIIMYTGILFLAVSPVPWLSWLAGQVFGLTVGLMNKCVLLIDSLPLSVIGGLFPTAFSTALMFLIIGLLAGWIATAGKKWFFALLFSVLFLALSFQLSAFYRLFA